MISAHDVMSAGYIERGARAAAAPLNVSLRQALPTQHAGETSQREVIRWALSGRTAVRCLVTVSGARELRRRRGRKVALVWMFGDLAEGRADSYSGCLRLASRLAHNVVEIGTQARTVAWLRRIGLGRRRDCEMHVTEMPCDLKAIRHNGRKLDTGGDALVQ